MTAKTYRYRAAKAGPLGIGEFIDQYIARRTDWSETTADLLRHSRKHIVRFFGETRDMRLITAGDADDFSYKLRETLAENSARLVLRHTQQVLESACRRKLILNNPLADVETSFVPTDKREFFVTREVIDRVLAACKPRVRLAVAFARFGGLRTPSELKTLWWENFKEDRFLVHSPKTQRRGKTCRWVPIFPELRPYVDGHPPAGPVYRWPTGLSYLHMGLVEAIKRAGLEPWPKLYQNLRSSRQTELTEKFPVHVVCEWMGNSIHVALRHYLQTTDAHFQAATQ